MLKALLQALRPFAIFGGAVLIVLGLSRAGLVLWQLDRVRAADMVGTVFAQGLRFDIVLVGFLLLLPVLTLPLFATSQVMTRIGGKLLRAYFAVCFAFVVFMELATPSFINQYDSRPNQIFVEYLIYPKEVGSTLVAAYGLQMLGALFVVTTATILLRRALLAVARTAPPVRVAAAIVSTPILLALCILATRSTFDHRAVNPSTVAISMDPMVNELALSSAYSVLYELAEQRYEPESGFRYGDMSSEEALQRVREEMRIPTEEFVAGEIPTLHRQTATAARTRPKNIVIVLEESLGAEHVGSLGGLPTTPHLDELMKQGICYTNLYATGTRSVRGLEALTTGFTPTPRRAS